jgi:predicted DNA-binding protein (MmcQ/YjbR family)
MTFDEFHAVALGLPGCTFDIKWGADRVYSVGGKMFAVAGHEGEPEPRYSMKVSDGAFDQLVEDGLAVPAPYMARAKWVWFKEADAMPDDQLLAYLRQAHGLVAAKLSRKLRTELGIFEAPVGT